MERGVDERGGEEKRRRFSIGDAVEKRDTMGGDSKSDEREYMAVSRGGWFGGL